MSINENQEFEAINQKINERKASDRAMCCSTEEIYRAKKEKAQKKAIVKMVVAALVAAGAMLSVIALAQFEWINATFCKVLLCVDGAVLAFKAGYLWHEIKN